MSIDIKRPILIYDDGCNVCTKFALLSSKLSKGYIQIRGHYNSPDIIQLKNKIFKNYDPTDMFWLITPKTAYGSRSGFFHVILEIFKSISQNRYVTEIENIKSCNYQGSCQTKMNISKRIINLILRSKTIHF